MTANSLDYPRMVQDALRRVVHRSLVYVQGYGLPGDHHFYLAFATGAPGVGISEELRQSYPEQITIVLQHDFRDLEVEDDYFAVTLRFGGVPQRIRVPYPALISFYDPAAQFALRFDPNVDAEDGEDSEESLEDTSSRAAVRAVLAAADRLAAEKEAAQRKIEEQAREAGEEIGEASPPAAEPGRAPKRPAAPAAAAEDGAAKDEESEPAPSDNVVSIDAFRRK